MKKKTLDQRSEDQERKIVVDKQVNITGSTAGAGSGEFSKYMRLKRREQARLRGLEEESRQLEKKRFFEEISQKRQEYAEFQEERRKSKRQKKDAAKKKRKENYKLSQIAKQQNQFANDGNFLEVFKQKEVIKEITDKSEEQDKNLNKPEQLDDTNIHKQIKQDTTIQNNSNTQDNKDILKSNEEPQS